MNKYCPSDSEYEVIVFDNKHVKKSLREYVYFPKEKKLFMPLEILGDKGFLCAGFDGVDLFSIEENGTIFVSAEWAIDEKMLGEEMIEALKKFVKRIQNDEFPKEE